MLIFVGLKQTCKIFYGIIWTMLGLGSRVLHRLYFVIELDKLLSNGVAKKLFTNVSLPTSSRKH